LIGVNKSNKIEAKKAIIPSVKQKAPAYNFHINLTNVNEKSKLKSNNNQIKSGNIIVNHVDDIQKLKLKVNAGLINSARSTIENEINSARSNSSLKQQIINKNIESIKKIAGSKSPSQNKLNPLAASNINRNLNTIDYPGESKILIIEDETIHKFKKKKVNSQRKFDEIDSKKEGKLYDKSSKQNIVIIEENFEDKNQKNKKNGNPKMISHKATISMPKMPSKFVYNNYNIINNVQNIFYSNNQMEGKVKDMSSHKRKPDLKNNSTIKDLSIIKKNFSKVFVPEYKANLKENKIKKTISCENSQSNLLQNRRVPLSARTEKDNFIITTKDKETIEIELNTERTLSNNKKINQILLSENKLDSSKLNSNQFRNDRTTTSSRIPFERINSAISPNNSIISRKMNPIKDLKTAYKEKKKKAIYSTRKF